MPRQPALAGTTLRLALARVTECPARNARQLGLDCPTQHNLDFPLSAAEELEPQSAWASFRGKIPERLFHIWQMTQRHAFLVRQKIVEKSVRVF